MPCREVTDQSCSSTVVFPCRQTPAVVRASSGGSVGGTLAHHASNTNRPDLLAVRPQIVTHGGRLDD